MHREILAEAVADERGMGILFLEARAFRPVADDDLAARPGHVQECIDVLFDGHAPDIGGDRARQREEILRMGLEHLGIDAPAPSRQVLEAMRREIPAYRGGAYHAARSGAVEPAKRPIGNPERDREARAQILRKLSVIRGRKGHAGPQAETPGARAQRSFGGDVQRLRRERENAALHLPVGQERQAYFRVRRAGDAGKLPWSDHADFVAEAAQPRRGLRQSADHAVRLGKPSVRDDHDSHAALESHPGMTKR